MSRACLLLVATLSAFAGACSSVTVAPGEEDAGVDAGPEPVDAGPDADAPPVSTLFECPAGAGIAPAAGGCPEFVPGSLGDCDQSTWTGFEGGSCHAVATCGPAGPPLPATLFESVAACAVTCGAAGRCATTKLAGNFKLDLPLEGQFCDDVEIRGAAVTNALLADLCAIAPEMRCEQPPGGEMRCRVDGGILTEAQVSRLCALTLVPKVESLWCWIYL